MISFVRDADLSSLQRKAGERLSVLLRGGNNGERASEPDKAPVLFLVSGGSALAILNYIDAGVLGPQCTVGILDDRWSTDGDINNFLKLSFSSFGEAARNHGCPFISTVPQTGETIEQTAERFEKNLRGWKERYPEGRVIITQGLGSDGHTAGIMPFPEDPTTFEKKFNDPAHWVAGYDAGNKSPYPQRITVTLSFLREVVDHALAYVAGDDKVDALQKALAPGSQTEIPGRVLQEMKEVEIYSTF